MSTIEGRLLKLREERAAREKARIEKLRELNLKKYNKNEPLTSFASNQPQKIVKSNSVSQIIKNNLVKNIFYVNGVAKRPATAPIKDLNRNRTKTISVEPKLEGKTTNYLQKNISALKNGPRHEKNLPLAKKDTKALTKADTKNENNDPNIIKPVESNVASKIPEVKKPVVDKKPTITNKINNDKLFERKAPVKIDKVLAEIKPFKKIDPKLTRKSIAVLQKPTNNLPNTRKSMLPQVNSSKETVFDRLYKPKPVPKKTTDEVEKLKTDPNYLKKVIKNSALILKRHTCFDNKEVREQAVRRSISAVHFKRVSKNEIGNCIHKWASIGDKLNKQHLTIDEGEPIKEEIVSAVKSERKKVKFISPMSRFNTPRPEELQARLKTWLQKRGKSLDAYQHLQCFGIHHLSRNPPSFEVTLTPKIDLHSDENKENIAVDSDSDDGSYADNMVRQTDSQGDKIDIDKWRQTSIASESMHTDFNETSDLNESTITSADNFVNIDELLLGALNDLTELLREGFDWDQSARYLRALRSRFPSAPRTAEYWECRAALEEQRGNLHASVQCWEEAVARGTEHNVVEANLDTLLNKFMQLKISPNSAAVKRHDPKMVDMKNVFKSTIIRFAVQQAKLRQSEAPIFTVTPVRRSGRLSLCPTPRGTTPRRTPREPLRLCESVKQVKTIAPNHVFKPNDNLVHTP